MLRAQQLTKIQQTADWDMVVIGGGATGLGIALDAQTRGFRTLLLEAVDFAKGTSSRSTKLVHGGVRYLSQGDIPLVREALRERGRLAKNAPHVVHSQPFVIPGDRWWSAPYYLFGLWLYDRLAGRLSLGRTQYLSASHAAEALQGVKKSRLRAGVRYQDGQFDDARLAINLAQSFHDADGCLLNYAAVTGLRKNRSGGIEGVEFTDQLQGKTYTVNAACVVNATGVFADAVLQMDAVNARKTIVPSQGVHIVVDRSFLPGNEALMVPKTSDGRVLFAVPWHNKVVIGTTDTLIDHAEAEPLALDSEIDFLLQTAADYLEKAPSRHDVRSVFVGLRPLAAPETPGQKTKEVSRSHKIEVSVSGLVSVIGGKWTTYRQMAEDAVDRAIAAGLLSPAPCCTHTLHLHGYDAAITPDDPLAIYGSDRIAIRALAEADVVAAQRIHPDYPFIYAEVAWAVQAEMAQTVEDVLARRLRLLFLDARASEAVAEAVAHYMAGLLGYDAEWVDAQVSAFTQLARQYYFKS